ncbi:MAG: DUF4416 family protein [Acidobacteria bacterium]|nr:DUF4416 family protein [Acidobacteriota bacterium]
MGQIRRPEPVKFFAGVILAEPGLGAVVEERLAAEFGPVDARSPLYPFDLTAYYEPEMGAPLQRLFLSFADLRAPGELAGLKLRTNAIETLLSRIRGRSGRPANIDPGYLELSKVVLASTKNFYHRIFLAEGIYGEVTMHFRDGAWQALPWTFPDFRSGRYGDFFLRLRQCYHDQLRRRRGKGPQSAEAGSGAEETEVL